MKRNSLGWWLAASNVAIVLLVALGISYFATDMLRDLADNQQKVRVQLAGANSRAEISRMAEDTLTYARVLAERPPLRRLLSEPGREGLKPFLRRFCDTSSLEACVVFDGAQVVASAGVELPWADLFIVAAEQGERFMAVPPGTQYSVVGATAKLPAQYASFSVMVVHLLDDGLARVLTEHSGFPVTLTNFRAYSATPDNEFTSLHSQAMTDGRFAVQRIESLGLYASSYPVFASSGECIALILTTASATETDEAVSSLVWRLIITAVAFAVLAVVAGVLLGWRVTKPAEALTDAAVRLGQGDFATSIPTAGPAEIGQLARTMDDMRRNLLDLNSELRHREAEAQVVLGAVVEGVYAVDQERNIRYLNPQAARLLGIEARDAIGKFCGDVLRPCGPDGDTATRPCATTACPILRARQAGSAQSVEQLQTRSGNRQAVITSSRVVDGLQVQVLRDETELEGVRRARDTVLANIGHEFRTPLAAQLASIELLHDGLKTAPPEKLEELVLSLERGTLRLTRLIDNLLESVRIESGQLDVRKQSIELRDVIEDARGLVEALLRQRRQPLEVDVPEGLTLLGDATRLAQVFVNLIANASKFAPEDVPIRVGARVDEKDGARTVCAWVEDSGPGLPEGADIFERFKRGGRQEPEPGGLGLGLWISRSIVERHGGTLTAARTAENRTRFTLALPQEGV
jgi:signal transduction histidine kinase